MLAILVMNALAVRAQLPRAPTFDEAEHLHATWLLSDDRRIYRDFAEDHSPLLPHLLQAVQPSEPSVEFPQLDVGRFLTWARVLMALLGTSAALAAGLFAYRVSGSPAAPVVVLACVLGSELTFLRGVADVRHDPPGLALFWLGALLIVKRPATRRGAISVGIGLGLLGAAALWNPKWPLVTLAFIVYAGHWLAKQRSIRQVGWTLGAAVAVGVIALAVLLPVASVGDLLFFVLTYNVEFASWFARSGVVGGWFLGKQGFHYCSFPFQPVCAALGCVLLASACAAPRVWRGLSDRPAWLLVISLAPVALAEMVLLYPWPRLWSQYYLMWSSATAVAYGCAQAAVGRLLSTYLPGRASAAARVGAAGFAVATAMGLYSLAWRELRRGPEPTSYFRDVAWIQQHLRAGDTVWLEPHWGHPIGAGDAAYYWFAFGDLTPFSLEFASLRPEDDHLPKLRMADLPPCKAAAGEDRSLRFISIVAGDLAEPCMRRLEAAGRLSETPVRGVLAVLHEEPTGSVEALAAPVLRLGRLVPGRD